MNRAFRVPVILMYHSVRCEADGGIYQTAISPDRFDRHIALLTSQYRILPLLEFVDALASRARMDGIACITFDDGYADNLSAARDILIKYGAPATVFVPVDYVGQEYFWWDALHVTLMRASKNLDTLTRELPAQFPDLPLSKDGTPANWSVTLWDQVRRFSSGQAYAAVEELAARLTLPLPKLPRPVSAHEVRQLANWPFEVGSHGVSHRLLPALPIHDAKTEIEVSRTELEALTGRPIRSFSYPFGSLDRSVASLCRAAGYSCGVSVLGAHEDNVNYVDVFDLPRFNGLNGDSDFLASQLEQFEQKNAALFVHASSDHPHFEVNPERRVTYFWPKADFLSVPAPVPGEFLCAMLIPRKWRYGHGTASCRTHIEQFTHTHAGGFQGRTVENKCGQQISLHARSGEQIDIESLSPSNSECIIGNNFQIGAEIADATAVLTSCNRHDLLERTLSSFRVHNTYRGVKRILVVEDGVGDPEEICRKFGAELIRVGERIGQARAVDLAYSCVDTKYVFHLEDDWEFYRPGFIEKSKDILDHDPSTLLVWLRAWDDTNGHPLSFQADDGSFGVLSFGYDHWWHGFTFNPALRRLSDYKRLGSFAQTRLDSYPWPGGAAHEAAANEFYFRLGYRAAILDKTGYVRHLGWGRRVPGP